MSSQRMLPLAMMAFPRLAPVLLMIESARSASVSGLMVVEGDRLVAVVALKDLLNFLSMKLDLERHSGEGWFSKN